MGGDLVKEDVKGDAKAINEEENIFPVTVPTMIYHGVMIITTLYFGMLFTDWGAAVIGGTNDQYYSSQTFSMTVKTVALAFTLVLFTVSITINICCPNRIL